MNNLISTTFNQNQNMYNKSKNNALGLIVIVGIVLTSVFLSYYKLSIQSPVQPIDVVTQNIDESLSQHNINSTLKNTSPSIPSAIQNNAPKYAVATIVGCALEVTSSKVREASSTTYSVNIKNIGTQICQNVSMSVYYAPEEQLISSTPKSKATNYWVIGQIGSGESSSITFNTNKAISNTEATEGCATGDNAKEDVCFMFEGSAISTPSPTNQASVAPTSTPTLTATPAMATPLVTPIIAESQENGVWVWVSPVDMNQSYRDYIISTAKKNSFNAVYVTIDDYLDIAFMPEGSAKTSAKNKYMDALELLIKQASQNGIAIDAEAGWRDWAESANIKKPFAIVDFVKEFNATRAFKLRTLQYDVEPYLMPTYEKNKATLLKNFVSLIDQTVTKLEGSDIAFSIVIPHFYDDTQKWTPSFSYNSKNTYTFNHLLSIMDRRAGSSIILMSYRNFANGRNSTIEISKPEVERASGGYKTKVIVAQETGNVDPDYVTFFSTSKNYYIEQTNIVKEVLGAYKNFGGMATHYLEPFTELE